MNEQSKQIYNYVSVKQYFLMVLAILFLISGIAILFEIPFLALFMMGFGAFCLWIALDDGFKLKKQLTELEQGNFYQALCMDFEKGRKYLNDGIRIGYTFAIGKKSNSICKISDITKVYIYVHKTNFVENGRELRAVVNNKECTLCILKLKKAFSKTMPDEEEIKKILAHLLTINPRIHIGYR